MNLLSESYFTETIRSIQGTRALLTRVFSVLFTVNLIFLENISGHESRKIFYILATESDRVGQSLKSE